MPRVIFICPYLKGNGQTAARRQFYVKYIATREGVELMDDSKKLLPATWRQKKLIKDILKDFPATTERFEYEDYMEKPTRENASAFITTALEQNLPFLDKRENYVDYIARRPRAERAGAHGLFSGNDDPLVLDQVAKTAAEHPGNMWMPIVSLRREDAARLGYDNAANWRAFLTSQAADIARGLKIPPERFHWYAAYHDEGHHPHVHMVCWSDDTREGFLTKNGIRDIKAGLASRLFRQELLHVYEQQTQYRNLLSEETISVMESLIARMENGTLHSESIEILMARLAEKLSTHKGKKQYGYLQAQDKELVDRIVDELAKDGRVADAYAKWCELRMEVLRTYEKEPEHPGPLSKQKELKRIRNIVVEEAVKIAGRVFVFEPFVGESDAFPKDDYSDADEQRMDEDSSATPDDENSKRQTLWYVPYRKAKALLRDEQMDIQQAVALFMQAAAIETGGFAAYRLGKLYLRGDDIPRNMLEAVRWLKQSSDQGNQFAQYALAMVYLSNGEIPKDITLALPLLQQSADAGNEHALYRLGRLYLAGEDVPKDTELAMRYLTDAAEHGNQYAQYTLGKLYLMGGEVPHDREKALHWLTQSAAQGNEYARFFLEHFDSFHSPSLFMAATRLMHHMGRVFRDNPPVHDKGSGSDSKQRRREREKKIAQGHAQDEHELSQNMN